MSLDHYEILKVVGKGSYGEVWLAKHRKDRKQFVIKKMEMLNASKRERTAAEQEAKLLSRLRHPNIVSYKDSFESEDGYLYIVMGFCDGGDLYCRLKDQKGTALMEKQVVEWFVQIAMALQYMHERNILHRDLKTQNIFLTKSKIIKVGDLGIARVLEGNNDMATTLIGTPYYMSPELFSNKPYNHKSDVWALGCCVYEMATLKHAFNAKDMNSLVYKILRGKMPAMPKTYSNDLIELIKAMLNLAPEKRPSVARILRNPFIKTHIAIFLEGTRSRRPSSGSSERRSSKPDIAADIVENTPRTASVSDLPHGSPLSPINEVPAKNAKKPTSQNRASSAGEAKKSAKTRPSSGSKEKKDSSNSAVPAKDGLKVPSARKGRPLPTPPAQAGTPRTSASVSKKPSSNLSRIRSSSSSSSVSSSKESVATPRTEEEGRRSVNASARARRREKLRESQESVPSGPTVRSSTDASAGRRSSNGEIKTRATRSKSDPTPPNRQRAKGREVSKGKDEVDSVVRRQERPSVGEDSSDEDSSEAPEKEKKSNDKELSAFSSLLESTLKLDNPKEEEVNEQPEEEAEDIPDFAEPPSRNITADPLSGTMDIYIRAAAPRAPKGLGSPASPYTRNATMTTSGRLMDRIAALRKDIMQGIGIELLQKAYESLDNEDQDLVEAELISIMGREKFDIYGGKIWQLKFCEETVFG
ncbi:uncharacterized protein [Asterias amurensis]|uniref:uncharacterized protein isoform X1 n=1 Tax=Asterias amurensis TaxID=7602 RepID=UPI003AB75096